MPTYNHARFIGEALSSVLSQTYTNWKTIVINNFSQDNTIEIIGNFGDPRISLINFNNGGVIAASRNEGIRRSKGEFIAFLDSDDVWFQGKLETQISYLSNNPDVGLAATNAQNIPNGDIRLPKISSIKNVSTCNLMRFNFIINSSVLVRKDVVEKVGLQCEDPGIRAAEDWEYWIRTSKVTKIHVLPEVLVGYRIHNSNIDSSSGYISEKEHLERCIRVLSRFRGIRKYDKAIDQFITSRQKYLASTYYRENYSPTTEYLSEAMRSKALLRTKLKILAWYFGILAPGKTK
jgi:glycosyltransferase involved in cell wall biosynthesis